MDRIVGADFNRGGLPAGVYFFVRWFKWIDYELPETRKIGLPLIVSLGYVADDIRKLAPLMRPFADAVELSTHYVGSDPRPMQRP